MAQPAFLSLVLRSLLRHLHVMLAIPFALLRLKGQIPLLSRDLFLLAISPAMALLPAAMALS